MLTFELLSEVQEVGGQKRVAVKYTNPDTGASVIDRRKVPAYENVMAWAADRISEVESGARDRELRQALGEVEGGADPDTVPLGFLDRGTLRDVVLRHLLNMARKENQREDRLTVVHRLAPYALRLTDAEIAPVVGWPEERVAGARTLLQDFLAAREAAETLAPEIELL